MRVTVVSRIFAPEPGAASLRLLGLVRALTAAGDTVRVLTSTDPAGGTLSLPGADIRRRRVIRDADGYVRGYLPYASFDVPAFFRLLFSPRPDVVVVEPPPTTGVVIRIACALRRVPYVYYAADVWSDAAGNATSSSFVVRTVRSMERWAWNGARTVLSVSEGVTDRLRALGVTSEIVTVGNGVDTQTFRPDGPQQSLDGPYFLYAGTASEVHGAEIFLDAFRTVHAERPDARLLFVGQGSDRDAIEAGARSLPPGVVRFEPRLEATEVSAWFRGALCALASVRPGVGYDFAFPTKLYAAVACGTPVIFTGVGPGAQFVDDPRVGRAVAYDTDAVAAAMLAELESPADAERRAYIATWSHERASLESVSAASMEAVRAAVKEPL